MNPATEEQVKVLLQRMEQQFSDVKLEIKQLKEANKPLWLSPKQFAQHTGQDVSTISRKCRLGKYKTKRDGGKWLIHNSELQ